MPRSRGGRSAPARAPSAPTRPTAPAPPPRAMGNQQQSRAMTTTAQKAPPQAAAQQSPGLFGQMASTAAGVAVGSSIGHAVGGFFGGGSSSSQQPVEQQAYQQPQADAYSQPMDQGMYNSQSQARGGYGAAAQQDQGPCAADVKTFTRCMDENRGDMTVCGWYMEQLKACQQAAKPY